MIWRTDNSIILDDEDEFAHHTDIFAYPPDLVAESWRSRDEVCSLIERRVYPMMAGVIAMVLAMLVYRENLTEAQSPYLASRILQPAGLVLLAICSAMALVLYRLAVQMGGGRLAVALRLLTIYVLLRGVLVLLRALKLEYFPDLAGWPDRYLFEVGWQIVPWVAALAAACRAELTVKAARELEQRRAARSALASV